MIPKKCRKDQVQAGYDILDDLDDMYRIYFHINTLFYRFRVVIIELESSPPIIEIMLIPVLSIDY